MIHIRRRIRTTFSSTSLGDFLFFHFFLFFFFFFSSLALPNCDRLFKVDHLTLYCIRLCPLDAVIPALGYAPAGSVPSSSTLQIFRDASPLWRLLCPPDYPFGHFPWHQYGWGSRSRVVFADRCWAFTHIGTPVFPFICCCFFLLFLQQGECTVWSNCMRWLLQQWY